MNLSKQQVFLILTAVVAFGAGILLSVLRTDTDTVLRVTGGLLIATGLFLLTSRSLIKRDPEASTARQTGAERLAVRRLRIAGATNALVGAAQFVPDTRMSTVLVACSAAVILATAFRRPRRLFSQNG